MPRWFSLTAAIAVPVVYLVSEYAKPAQGSSSGLMLFLLTDAPTTPTNQPPSI
jgi:hypothetical protein